jgi:Na+/melibiose symporter-like transporter
VSALPALMAVFLALPMGEFLTRRPQVVPWLAWGRALSWLSYPLIGLLPFAFSQNLPLMILGLWGLATLPQVMHVVALNVVLGAVGDETRRFRLLSRRWSVTALVTALAVVLINQTLPRIAFPLGYQLLFLSSVLATWLCYAAMSRVRLPPDGGLPPRSMPRALLRRRWRDVLGNRTFLRFLAAQFVFACGLQLTVPLLSLYWVRSIHASDAIISLIAGAQLLAAVAAYLFWARVAPKWGKRWILLVCCLGLSFYPAMTAATAQPWLLVPWAAIAGLFAAGIDLTFVGTMMSAGQPDEQPVYVSLYMTSANMAAFLAPLVGTLAASWIGLGPALMGGSLLRLLGFGLMVFLRVGTREAEPLPAV